MKQFLILIRLLILIISLIGLCCCTSNPVNPSDPMESWNRKVFAFNLEVDKKAFKPISETYVKVTPKIARKGINNFFSNIGDLQTTFNGMLQSKGQVAIESFWRVIINTTFGFGGLLDFASELNIPKNKLNFTSTLRYWQVPAGNYVVLPFIGPSNYRGILGFVGDYIINPTRKLSPKKAVGVTGVYFVNKRANFGDYEKMLENAIFDKYSFVRNLFLRYDGKDMDTDLEDEYDSDMDWYDED